MDTEPVIRTSQAILESRQSRGGAWGFVANQDAVEPTCFVILALRHQPSAYVERALDVLENLENKDGSWPAFLGDDLEGCWTTALVVLTLLATRHKSVRVHRGIQWLLNARAAKQTGYGAGDSARWTITCYSIRASSAGAGYLANKRRTERQGPHEVSACSDVGGREPGARIYRLDFVSI
jgi:hypothetical protein